jgi:hypoxanthine phosphoribosyltransferase
MTDRVRTPARTFRHRHILAMQLTAYDHAVRLLAEAAAARFTLVSAVIGIAKGRLAAQHNATDAIYTEATGQVTVDVSALAAALRGRRAAGTVLLVDDICGTGATFTAVVAALRPFLQPDGAVRTVALCRNAGTSQNPDLWVWTVDDWVHFPWEQPLPAGIATEDLPTPERVESE